MYSNNENIKNSREAHPSLSIYDFSKADANMYKNDKLSIIFGQKQQIFLRVLQKNLLKIIIIKTTIS